MMGMPVNRLKLYAFAFGAGVAGLTGTLFASLRHGVFSADFDTPLLITIYAILILGGAGSLGGVILGALVVNVTLEVLRTPNHATWVFFVADHRHAAREAAARGKVLGGGVRRHDRLRLRGPRDRRGALAGRRSTGTGRSRGDARPRARALGPDPVRLRARRATGPSSRSWSLILVLTTLKPFWRNLVLSRRST